jgi:DNA-binding NarL/FixJ family response regulator
LNLQDSSSANSSVKLEAPIRASCVAFTPTEHCFDSQAEGRRLVAVKARVRQFNKEWTQRQRDIVQLFAEGRQMKEIAGLLH